MQYIHFIQLMYFEKYKNIAKLFLNKLNSLRFFNDILCISFDEMLF